MTMSDDTRDIAITTNVELKQLQKDLEAFKETVEDRLKALEAKQQQVLDILTQAKGIRALFRWGIWIAGPTGGYFVSQYWDWFKAVLHKIGS